MGRVKSLKREFVDPSDLTVHRDGHPQQASIRNSKGCIENFDAHYFEVSGYFGIHSPHTFAMAPKLLAHLEFAVKLLSGFPALSGHAQIDAMRTAIAQAKGPEA